MARRMMQLMVKQMAHLWAYSTEQHWALLTVCRMAQLMKPSTAQAMGRPTVQQRVRMRARLSMAAQPVVAGMQAVAVTEVAPRAGGRGAAGKAASSPPRTV